MKHSTRNILKACAVILTVLLVYPSLLLSASAIDAATEEEPQVIAASLQSIMEENTEETTRVAIWLKDYDTPEALATESMPDYQTRIDTLVELEESSDAPNEAMRSIEIKRAALRLCYEPYTLDFGEDFLTDIEEIYCSTYLPIIIADLSTDRIEEISNLDMVESIDYYCDDVAEEEDTESVVEQSAGDSTSATDTDIYYPTESHISYINASSLRASMTSSHHISVGILDVGNPNYGHNIFSDNYVEVHYTDADTDSHATNVLEIFSTVAPHADFYCTTYTGVNSTLYANYISEIDWLISRGVSVINMSLRLRYVDLETGDETIDDPNIYGSMAQYLDKIVYIYSILIVKAASNLGVDGIGSGGMAYNILTVGNYNRGAGEIDDDSSYYSGSTLAKKPDISAPGYFVFLNGSADDSGTSYAAPLVAGVATLLIATNTSLMEKPALVKSILMASTKSDHRYIPRNANYQYYGAGVIDAENARSIATSMNYRTTVAATTVGEYKEYTISVTEGSVARIALVFEKANTTTRTYTLGDLDLYIYDDTDCVVDNSITSNNNVEIVEFTAPSSGTYTIRITTYSIPQDGNYKTYPSASVAWLTGGN